MARDVTRLEPAGDDGAATDLHKALDEILGGLGALADPLDAEIVGSLLVGLGASLGDGSEHVLLDQFLPTLEASGDPRAARLLAALGALCDQPVADRAAAAVDRLRDRGVAAPAWAEQLSVPVTARDCVEILDADVGPLVLAARFERAGRTHAVLLLLDPEDCGEVAEVALLDGPQLPLALAELRRGARRDKVKLVETPLDPAEFRYRAETAIDVREDHDRDEDADLEDEEDLLAQVVGSEDGPGFRALAALLRARLRALPDSGKPKPPHPQTDDIDPQSLFEAIAQLGARTPYGGALGGGPGRPRRAPVPKLPVRRKTKDGPAPILQVRVDLSGAKPPIWRRLQVPADITLAALHEVLQTAFGWDDYHMHVFETPYGAFGQADPELGHRADRNVTLEQVARESGTKITYTYDFGDSWEHLIAVEKTLEPEPSAAYPRCVAGRRAAPPEDCGGAYGYMELVEILADPAHPEHQDRLEWLGLDDARAFDPAAFDLEQINSALAHSLRPPKAAHSAKR